MARKTESDLEIERKFLVLNDRWKHMDPAVEKIRQGYARADSAMRIYINIDKSGKPIDAFLTLKAKDDDERLAWKRDIPTDKAMAMQAKLCADPVRINSCAMAEVSGNHEPAYSEHHEWRGDIDPKKCNMRVRISRENGDTKAFLTLKTKSDTGKGPNVRNEWEFRIPVKQAQKILELVCEHIIDKTRYHVDFRGRHWIVDEFTDEESNKLHLAEVELKGMQDRIPTYPPFVSEASEVTAEEHRRYFSSRNIARALNDAGTLTFDEILAHARELIAGIASSLRRA